jgi:hypothetical protein
MGVDYLCIRWKSKEWKLNNLSIGLVVSEAGMQARCLHYFGAGLLHFWLLVNRNAGKMPALLWGGFTALLASSEDVGDRAPTVIASL